jgi:hypothetical protein
LGERERERVERRVMKGPLSLTIAFLSAFDLLPYLPLEFWAGFVRGDDATWEWVAKLNIELCGG